MQRSPCRPLILGGKKRKILKGEPSPGTDGPRVALRDLPLNRGIGSTIAVVPAMLTPLRNRTRYNLRSGKNGERSPGQPVTVDSGRTRPKNTICAKVQCRTLSGVSRLRPVCAEGTGQLLQCANKENQDPQTQATQVNKNEEHAARPLLLMNMQAKEADSGSLPQRQPGQSRRKQDLVQIAREEPIFCLDSSPGDSGISCPSPSSLLKTPPSEAQRPLLDCCPGAPARPTLPGHSVRRIQDGTARRPSVTHGRPFSPQPRSASRPPKRQHARCLPDVKRHRLFF